MEHSTSLILSEAQVARQINLVRVYFSIEAVIFLEHDCDLAGLRVDAAPVCDTLSAVDLWHDLVEMTTAERLDRSALPQVRQT